VVFCTKYSVAAHWASILWNRYHLKPPVDLFYLTKQLGIDIEYDDLSDGLGAYSAIIDSKPVIVVNQNHGLHRRRWSVAHEICELFAAGLRTSQCPMASICTQVKDPKRCRERFMDKFAAELLAPSWTLQRMAERVTLPEPAVVAVISHMFQVSETAVTIRLKECGLTPKTSRIRLPASVKG
jgi:Zn-dependent peptidase ImmA (M78 family)